MTFATLNDCEGVGSFGSQMSMNVRLAAAAADPSNYIELKENMADDRHFVKEIIRNETVKRLSNEAKEVIELVLDSPMEIISAYGRPSKDLIKKELRKRGWKHKIIQLVFEEIELFVKEIC